MKQYKIAVECSPKEKGSEWRYRSQEEEPEKHDCDKANSTEHYANHLVVEICPFFP
jgi:hypothetical protein